MPSNLSSEKRTPDAVVDETEKSYQKLLAFLDLASGSTFAVARCNLPSLRKEIIQRATADAAGLGVTVKESDISSTYSGDFAAAVKAALKGVIDTSRLAVMVTGIDGLIYKSASAKNLSGEGRTPFIASLNFNREQIAHKLPFPVVLWLESESLKVFLKQAPDFTQWISGHFQFGGGAAEVKALDELLEGHKSLRSQPAKATKQQLQELEGWLQELSETSGRQDAADLRKRLSVLDALAARYIRVSNYIEARKHWAAALDIARILKDRRLEGRLSGNLGLTYADSGEFQRAMEFHQKSLHIAREIGDRGAEAHALNGVGNTYLALGEVRRAIACYEESLVTHREIGNASAEAGDLGNLGIALKALGQTRRAIQYHEQALGIARKIGDRRREANELGNIGIAYAELGELPRAIDLFAQCSTVQHEIGDLRGEANSLGNLGVAYKNLGETRRAIELYEKQLAATRKIHDRRGEGIALGNLGVAYADLGETLRAVECYQQRLIVARETLDRFGEGYGLWNLSLAVKTLGDLPRAIANAEAALKIFEEIEEPKAGKVRQQLAEWKSQPLTTDSAAVPRT